MKVRRYIACVGEDVAALPVLWSEQSDGRTIYFLSEEAQVGELVELPAVDWDQQAQFSPYYRDGQIEFPVGEEILYLVPGPGFGDLSHPTTQLILELMSGRMTGERVLDVGCGNGVLTLAALLLGAESAHGVDIDPDALAHAELNRERNQLPASFSLPRSWVKDELVLLNMVLQEQEVAFAALGAVPDRMLVTGLLVEQRDYWQERCGYCVEAELEKEGWWAGVLHVEPPCRRR